MYSVIPCSHCQTQLRALPEKAGQSIRCWSCSAQVVVPAVPVSDRIAERMAPYRWKWSLNDLIHSPRTMLTGAALLGLALATVIVSGLYAVWVAGTRSDLGHPGGPQLVGRASLAPPERAAGMDRWERGRDARSVLRAGCPRSQALR